MSPKLEYTKKALLKQVLLEYYSIIKVFMKFNADIVAEHQTDWDHKIHLEEGKKIPFMRNYKLLLDQKTAAMKKYIDKHLRKGFIWPSLSASCITNFISPKTGRKPMFLHRLLRIECSDSEKQISNIVDIWNTK